jgi:hypothetical protein
MAENGVNGAQLWIRNTGAVYFLAAGLKWHAGSGSGWRSIPANQGNANLVGIETDHTFGQEWTTPMLASIVVVTQELCSLYDIDPDQWCCGHKEYAPNRKPDPENFDLDAWRAAVKRGGTVVISTEEDELMGAKDDIVARIEQLEGRIFNRTTGSQSVYDEIRYATDDRTMPELEHQGRKFTLISASQTGAVYACAPGVFYHVSDPGQLSDGQVAGVYSTQIVQGDQRFCDAVRWLCLRPSSDLVPIPPPKTCTVAAGDTLSRIAAALGVTIQQLVTWNSLKSPDEISVGQVLKVSGG